MGVRKEAVTLHVGLGTFLPVTAQDTSQHRMHAESAQLDGATAARLNGVHAAGRRILTVGTTSRCATLESAVGESAVGESAVGKSAAGGDGVIHPFAGDTEIFITPGYRFPCQRPAAHQFSPAAFDPVHAGLPPSWDSGR